MKRLQLTILIFEDTKMKFSSILNENDIYNNNQKLKNMVENVIPQLQKMIVQKINSDDYQGAAELLNKLKMVAAQCSVQIQSFSKKGMENSNNIKNTEL